MAFERDGRSAPPCTYDGRTSNAPTTIHQAIEQLYRRWQLVVWRAVDGEVFWVVTVGDEIFPQVLGLRPRR